MLYQSLKSHIVGLAVLLAATMFFFAPVLFDGEQLAGSDFQQIHYPLLNFVVDNIHENGEIPLWNPHQFLGYSVVGNPQYGMFYPPNWLLVAFPDEHIYDGVGLLVALHFFWLALGSYALAQHWGANRAGSLMAAFIIAFGGFSTSKLYAGHYAVLLTLAWTPWILASVGAALRVPRWPRAVLAATTVGFAILAGHPQFVYISAYGAGAVVLYHLFTASDTKHRLQQLRQAMIISVVGVCLGAVVLLPTYDYQSQTVRGQAEDSLNFANQHAIPPQQLGSVVVADLFGTPTSDIGYWGEPFYEEMAIYVGILPLLLLYFVFHWRPRGWLLFGGLALFGLWMSLGENAGLYVVQYYLVPPARGFRAPGRFLLLTTIGLGILTALTITRLDSMQIDERNAFLRRAFLPAMIIFGGSAIALAVLGDSLQDNSAHAEHITIQLSVSTGFVILLTLVFGLWYRNQTFATIGLIAIVAANLWWAAVPLRNTDEVTLSPVWERADALNLNADGAYGRIMQTGSPPGIINGASWIETYSPQGYDPIAPAGWFELMDATGQFIEDAGSATNRLFSVRYVVAGQPLQNYGFATAQFFEPVALLDNQSLYFYENPLPLSRAYLTQNYVVEPDTATAIARIQRGEVDRGNLILLPERPDCDVSDIGGTATITSYQANRVEVLVNAAAPTILVLADQYDPDWQVFVDHDAAELLRVNTTFRGVCVPMGEHTVVFDYQPRWFWRGAILSGIGWVFIMVIGIAIVRQRKSLKLPTTLNLFSL